MPRHQPQPSSRAVPSQPSFPHEDGASESTTRNVGLSRGFAPESAEDAAGRGERGVRGTGFERMPEDLVEEDEDEEDEEDDEDHGDEDEDMREQEGDEDGEGDEEEEEEEDDGKFVSAPIPPNLREISSLASWTVSTHKPGCGVAALRNPSPSLFWQSDGPQPHSLTLHFFKRVSIVRMRVYLDFELDESYTPTKMVFLAGMGGNDLVEFATWEGESPCGWVDIPLEGVGGSFKRKKWRRRHGGRKSNVDGEDGDENTGRMNIDDNDTNGIDNELQGGGEGDELGEFYEEAEDDIDIDDPYTGNVLKAMVVQVRVCENHQNGKDTHVRGFQVFARDDRYFSRTRRNSSTIKDNQSGAATTNKLDPTAAAIEGFEQDVGDGVALARFDEADWLQEPEIR